MSSSSTIVVTHNAGFFSCCSIRLEDIVQYFNTHNCHLPQHVDSTAQFEWYKPTSSDDDVTFQYFVHYDEHDNDDDTHAFPTHRVFHDHEDQFVNYQILSYADMTPFIRKYFTPSLPIYQLVESMELKYTVDYANTCVLFYRGNDKAKETMLCPYEDMFKEADAHVLRHPSSRLLIQSDETEFIHESLRRYPQHAFFFADEIRHMSRTRETSVDCTGRDCNAVYSKYYLAITVIMSRCRWILCTSGNCSIFMMYYREHAQDVRQYLNGEWFGHLS